MPRKTNRNLYESEARTLNMEMRGSVDRENVKTAERIEVCQPGSNMLWVEIDWGNRKDMLDVKATPENKILFDREKFTFNGQCLYSLLFGNEHSRAVLMNQPYVAVKPGPYNDTYRLWVEDEVNDVLTPPSESKRVLEGIVDCTEYETHIPLKDMHDDIMENQVNRSALLNLLDNGFFEEERIEPKGDGFVIDDYFLLTWESKFHIFTEQWKEGAFTPSGNPKEKPGEFREITVKNDLDDCYMELNGVNYHMSEKEWVFVRRLQWILNWKENMDNSEISSVERTVPILQEYDI